MISMILSRYSGFALSVADIVKFAIGLMSQVANDLTMARPYVTRVVIGKDVLVILKDEAVGMGTYKVLPAVKQLAW